MNSFSEFCAQYGQGSLDHLVAESLREIVRAVMDTGKAGKLTLSIKVSPNDDGSVLCDGDVKTAVPKPSVGGAIFFTTADGDLLRRDPRQGEFNLREVTASDVKVRTLNGE
jgi:hypothetical protein